MERAGPVRSRSPPVLFPFRFPVPPRSVFSRSIHNFSHFRLLTQVAGERGLLSLVLDEYKKRRILEYNKQGYSLTKFLARVSATGSTARSRRAGSGRPSKITAVVKSIVEQRMQRDDETTAQQLHAILVANAGGKNRARAEKNGWTVPYNSRFTSVLKPV